MPKTAVKGIKVTTRTKVQTKREIQEAIKIVNQPRLTLKW